MKLRSTIIMAGITVVLFIAACSRQLPPQESCNFVQNPDLQRVAWKQGLPVKLYLHKSVPVAAYDAIDRAITEFNSDFGHGRELFRIVARGADGDLNPAKDGYSMIYWYDTWDASRPTEQARTTIYWSGSEIFEADMRINAHNFNYNFDDVQSFSSVDLQSLLVHELGHVLGLAHTNAVGSAMHATLDVGQIRRTLGAVDMRDLKCEY